MVKYIIATSVALVQLALLVQTSVALPIDARNAERLESRGLFNSNGQQKDTKTKMIHNGLLLTGLAAAGAGLWHVLHVRRDPSDLYERGWDEYQKRSSSDFKERDWNDFEERDWDNSELEARGLDSGELDKLD